MLSPGSIPTHTSLVCVFLACSYFLGREWHAAEFTSVIPFPGLVSWSFMYDLALTTSREMFMRDCGFWQYFRLRSIFCWFSLLFNWAENFLSFPSILGTKVHRDAILRNTFVLTIFISSFHVLQCSCTLKCLILPRPCPGNASVESSNFALHSVGMLEVSGVMPNLSFLLYLDLMTLQNLTQNFTDEQCHPLSSSQSSRLCHTKFFILFQWKIIQYIILKRRILQILSKWNCFLQ